MKQSTTTDYTAPDSALTPANCEAAVTVFSSLSTAASALIEASRRDECADFSDRIVDIAGRIADIGEELRVISPIK